MTKFSVVIPVYNVAPYLRECLDSVLAQRSDDWEAICVDDGSNDGSAEILDGYAARDNRFVVIHRANAGVSAARNDALNIAKGDWICFLDADDCLSPYAFGHCSKLIAMFEGVDIIRYRNCNFTTKSDLMWTSPNGGEAHAIDLRETVDQVGNSACLWMQMFRRGRLAGLSFPSCAYYEDMVFVYEALDRCNKLVDTNSMLYGYRIREGSAMRLSVSDKWLYSLIYAPSLALQVVERSAKRFTALAIRQNCNKLTEEFYAKLYDDIKDCGMRGEWRQKWHMALRGVLENKKVVGFQRMRIRALVFFKVAPIEYLLCYVPNWLKRKGLHR